MGTVALVQLSHKVLGHEGTHKNHMQIKSTTIRSLKMNSPFIFLQETQEISISLNPHEKTYGFVHPWWDGVEGGALQQHYHDDIKSEENVQKDEKTFQKPLNTISQNRLSTEEGRTFILLFSIAFLLLIILILLIWVKRMKSAKQCPEKKCNGSLPDNDTATEMKIKDVDLPTYREAAQGRPTAAARMKKN